MSTGGSPKMPPKFQTARLRNSIDSFRNIVVQPTAVDMGKTAMGIAASGDMNLK